MSELKHAQNIMRRMPVAKTMKSLAGLIDLCPAISDDLLANVDQPLKVAQDPATGKSYILCDYNRDGDAYRSPWSNKYYDEDGKEFEDGYPISAQLRSTEVEANTIFDVYRKLYFETGISSVYFFESEGENTFGAAFLIHKDVPATGSLKKGVWDSVHVFRVAPTGVKDEFEYTLTSSVIISMNLNEDSTGDVDLSGTIVEQVVKKHTIEKYMSHISNMGAMVEAHETTLRNKIESIYIQKTREVLSGARISSNTRDFKMDFGSLSAGLGSLKPTKPSGGASA